MLGIFMPQKTSAHQDFWVMGKKGNVRVRVKTGYQYEIIKKAFMIGEMASKLAENLSYSKPIFLDFVHNYVGDCEPDYFICCNKGEIWKSWYDSRKGNPYLKSKALVVRQVASDFDVEWTLKLVEYAITNHKDMSSAQSKIAYNQNYCQWEIETIDTSIIAKQLLLPKSDLVESILGLTVDRPVGNFYQGVSYNWQNNQYHVFVRNPNKADSVLIILDDVYYIEETGYTSALIFDTDSSFYYVNGYKMMISKRHVINGVYENFRPFTAHDIGGNKLSISFRYFKENFIERTLIYLTDQDVLIQDLDELIKKE